MRIRHTDHTASFRFEKSFKLIKTILIFEKQIFVESCTAGVLPTVNSN